jgi:hypothetical protein
MTARPGGEDAKAIKRPIRRRPGRYVLLVFLTVLAVVQFLNFTGFCYSQGRYYSDQDVLDLAIAHTVTPKDPERSKLYSSAQEFRDQNPNCCILHRWGDPLLDPIWVRFFGFYVAVADIWFKAPDAQSIYGFYNSFVPVNACGRILKVQGIQEQTARVIPKFAK